MSMNASDFQHLGTDFKSLLQTVQLIAQHVYLYVQFVRVRSSINGLWGHITDSLSFVFSS